ncbi:MAG: glycoside hydrolase family 127 protein [Prevotella sp.]|nr:glycoside hydrolase family 127 protein [Prevotella sp.]
MKNIRILFISVLLACCGQACLAQGKAIEQVDFSNVRINDSFWSPQLKKNVEATIPVCIDQIENKTDRIKNYENAARGQGKHSGIFFDDSDVYKAMEGYAYSLINHPDAKLEAKVDEWTDKIAAAQQSDGYLNTYYTLTGLDKRWTNMDKHEMYCAGHLLEAGVAYFKATGKRKLLDVGQRMADYMMSVFGEGKRHWVPGHEEIELALVKLYEVTGQKKYLDFAYWLLEQRGHGYGSNDPVNNTWNPIYYQDHTPVREYTSITGHAVRAMYLFCGMADVAAYIPGTGYLPTLETMWDDVVRRNMYITGGIGSSRHNEGFTADYDLPNKSAYCETCASIGMVYWNHRMNEFTGEGRYADVMERAMYNGVISGISLEGDKFFYVNPLESDGDHHRQEWYGCACCPSNVCRFIPSLGSYIYGTSKDALWINLFIGNDATIKDGKRDLRVAMETNYPWKGHTTITLKDKTKKAVKVRIPGWCKKYQLKVNGNAVECTPVNGYASISRRWKAGDKIEVDFDMPVMKIAADERVKADEGCLAVQRGPVVYCAEQADNTNVDDIRLSATTSFNTMFDSTLLGGVVKIFGSTQKRGFTLIPYYAWDNREAGKMKVWLPLLDGESIPTNQRQTYLP